MAKVYMTPINDILHIETWYEKSWKVWASAIFDAEGFQISNVIYDHKKDNSINSMIKESQET